MIQDKKTAPVPKGRLARLGGFSRLAGRVAGNMLTDSGKQLLQGRKPAMKELLISEKNLHQLADKLATMRGAAMKAGQLLSMDAGSLVPEELAIILERLRDDAVIMPAAQLFDVMERNWGHNWEQRLQQFSFKPIAAASIGQVHRAVSPDGREMAVKIQYPGVKDSIDSDLDNVFSMLRLSGLIPDHLDVTPLLEEARRQLKLEADYLYEGEQINRYRSNIEAFARRDELRIPEYYPDMSTAEVLCMSYLPGKSLNSLQYATQEVRNHTGNVLFELFLAEFLDYRCVQTDPNPANFLYDDVEQKLILLDFGATRHFSSEFAESYRQALIAATEQNRDRLADCLAELGFFQTGMTVTNREVVLDIFMLATEPMRSPGAYDFYERDITGRLHELGQAIKSDPEAWHTPPPDILFLHRKLAGLYLLLAKLRVQTDVHQLFSQYR